MISHRLAAVRVLMDWRRGYTLAWGEVYINHGIPYFTHHIQHGNMYGSCMVFAKMLFCAIASHVMAPEIGKMAITSLFFSRHF